MDVEFSIVITVYNIGRKLQKAIESVINQSFGNIEIVIIDDGSTDAETLSICEQYAKKHNKIKLYHKKNGGVSSARNYGIKVSTGKYITFLDGDDCFEKHAIMNYRNVIEKCIEKTQIVFSNYTIYNEETSENLKREHFESIELYTGQDLEKLLMSLYYNSNYGWLVTTACFKREFLIAKDEWFREDLDICEDFDWLLRLMIRAEIVVTANINSLIYSYYSRPRKENLKRYASQVKASVYWINYFRKCHMSTIVKETMENIFEKLFVVFSFHIVEMDQRERGRAYTVCKEGVISIQGTSSLYMKVFCIATKIFGVKVSVSILSRLYAAGKVVGYFKKPYRGN